MGKEEDKIEKLIRGLLKLPENRRCINCNSLGPQYVCTTFWTFVCTNCSGVHREFTHRVKSVSMAKFSMEEVHSLQAGGNEKAREVYFKTWNPHRNVFPDNSNIQKLRDFIKQVYVDRRYTDENHHVLIPRIKNSDKDESYERKRQDVSRERAIDRHSRYIIDDVRTPGYSRDINDEKYSRYSNNEVRSPGYSKENSRYDGLKANSSRFEATDGRYQVDDARIAGRSATQMFTTEDIKPRKKSPPPVRNVREFLGERFVSLRVGEQTKKSVYGATNGQVGDRGSQNSPRETINRSKIAHKRSVSANIQTTVQPTNKTLAINDCLKSKGRSEGSLVDFTSFPPPPPPPDVRNQNQLMQIQVTEPSVKEEVCRAPPPKNTLEFLLFELSTPVEITLSDPTVAKKCEDSAPTVPSTNSSTLHYMSTESCHTNDDSLTLQLALQSTQEFRNTPTTSTGIQQSNQTVPNFISENSFSSFVETSKDQVPSHLELESSCTAILDGASTAIQTSHLHENSNHQAKNLFLEPSAEVDLVNSTQKSLLDAEGPAEEKKPTLRSSGRAELPEDLFVSLYPSRAMSAPVWQMSPSYDMGFNMHYYQNAPTQTPPFSNCCKSINPFDTNDDATQHQFTTTSSVPIEQVGFAPTGILRTQNFESHLQCFPSSPSPSIQSGGYVGQFHSTNIPPYRSHEIGALGGAPTTGLIHLNQHSSYQYPTPADLRPFSMGGGNPFG
ncbi:uncharacterized protein LOC141614881 [Silene latifolia]|uniref:uncharacterized protein LOC141614881 n=1 Tax=Silene latifolia TaxID=37657 RepID=UPI003D77C45F